MTQPKRIKLFILLFITPFCILAQNNKNETLKFTKSMELKIIPSATSSQNDFDFLEGKWKVHNRKLKIRLSNNTEWDEFESTLHMKKALNGFGNVENYYAAFNSKPFEGLAVRLFNPDSKLWTIYWMDTNSLAMDKHPVTGSFEDRVGKFYAKDTLNGKEIVVLYQWDATNANQPKWSQAFSPDNGKTLEWNWEMVLMKME
jgi:hypothetical protein